MKTIGTKLQRFFASATHRWYFWAVFFLGAISLPVARSITRDLGPPPPVLGELPRFDLIDENGEPITLEDLRGRVWVANFIFTSCAEICPKLSERMAKLQDRLANMGDAVRLVSFSVDPVRDTPTRLAAYAQRFHARPGFWSFVTGPEDALERTIETGFKVAMERNEDSETGFFDIVHGEHFVLVDQLGRIRGYYRSDEAKEIQRLLNELGYLANLGPDAAESDRSVLDSKSAAATVGSR
jgi:protein SCO1/2